MMCAKLKVSVVTTLLIALTVVMLASPSQAARIYEKESKTKEPPKNMEKPDGSVDKYAEEPSDRLTSIYNYIKQLVQGISGQEKNVDIFKKIRDHVEETYAVHEPNELEDDEGFERLCQTTNKWVLLNRTLNTNGEEVEIVHDIYAQWYHYYECVDADQPCLAIKDNFESSCVQTEAFQLMYARPLGAPHARPTFMYVLVPRDCVCKAHTIKANQPFPE
ncbi:uncharacterized protein LOC100905891 [Galendromus occidentalis]|uniref:Uncharacterized protein LOC100905891 n=1 Tax=Galendromus occidentalis TaxID=34638 RepID=A0AAJ6QM22_9ACAR|nr:uncharacterized protein LOC100905891 [Galendromus occidentalis]